MSHRFALVAAVVVLAAGPSMGPIFRTLSLEIANPQSSAAADGQPESVQPTDFDPATHHWKKRPQNGWPKELYCSSVDSCEAPQMNINGWEKEGAEKIRLPAPYDLDFYEFGAASSTDYVLELKKDGKRLALYRNVDRFLSLPSGPGGKLALKTWTKSGAKWHRLIEIVDVASGVNRELPHSRCTEDLGRVSGQYLVTHSGKNDAAGSDNMTEFCVWDENGGLIGRLEGKVEWVPLSANALTTPFGVLPKDPKIFYAFNRFGAADKLCSLELQDLTNQKNSTQFKIPEPVAGLDKERGQLCPTLELNFDGLTTNSKELRYRLKGDVWKVVKASR